MTEKTNHIDLKFPEDFLEFTRLCEVYCVAACCGLDAFDFAPEVLASAIESTGKSGVAEMCGAVTEFAQSLRSEKRECWSDQDDFGHCWENGEKFSSWVEELVSAIRAQLAAGKL